jgi:hypothetical protein
MADAREAYGYVDENVGVLVVDARESYGYVDESAGPASGDRLEGYGYVYENVGVSLIDAREAHGYGYWGDVSANTPVPHIWYLRPNYGREGWESRAVGHGFGATQATYAGQILLNALAGGIVQWHRVDALAGRPDPDPDRQIIPDDDVATPEHQEIRWTVPAGGVSGVVKVTTNGP